MNDPITLRINRRGGLTLPQALRATYALQPGDRLTLLDLGGVFVLSPRPNELDTYADQLRQELSAQGESLESMRAALRQARRASAV